MFPLGHLTNHLSTLHVKMQLTKEILGQNLVY